jgi:hypothetical protein
VRVGQWGLAVDVDVQRSDMVEEGGLAVDVDGKRWTRGLSCGRRV